eukprot:TRINITY_DN12661_c0_g2_i4.p1 TRINITY_DN12661_c0_g2~~TRINITY_DN12661_c0_g2_i4.p1  ORF type:complete len:209 (+),score=17.28 TRINITY_DN12661_c0_g2_i4:66-692(+)
MAGTANHTTSPYFILHLRNIPCKVLEADLRNTMWELGLDVSRYELYFPKRTRRLGRSNNYGYGFVHCSRAEDAEAFSRSMHGFRFENIDSSKRLAVETANRSSVALPDGLNSALDQSGASYEVGAWTTVDTWGSSTSSCTSFPSSSPVPYLSANTSLAEHSAALPAAYMECPIGSGVTPDVCEVPPTRLAGPSRALADESSHMTFRYQ